MLRARQLRAAVLCVLVMPFLQGCVLTRVMETRAQLCDEQPSRVLISQEPGRGLRVVFEEPTLTDQDVIWLVGFEPSETGGTKAVRELVYEARPLHRRLDRASSLVSRLSFTHLRGEYRLAELEIPEKFNSILPPALLAAAVKVACNAQIVVVPPGTRFDLTPVDRATLPTRDALRQLLGPPTAEVPGNAEFSYQYCLAPCDAGPSMVANLRFSFGLRGELRRLQASYFRYSATVDLTSSRSAAAVELLDLQ